MKTILILLALTLHLAAQERERPASTEREKVPIERPTPGKLKDWNKRAEFLARIQPADRNKRNTSEQREATKDLYFEVTEEDIEVINARLNPHIRVGARQAENGRLYIPLKLISDPVTYPVRDLLVELMISNNVQFPAEEETP